MALKKRKTNQRLRKAVTRLAAMIEIDRRHGRMINYGGEENPLTAKVLEARIEKCRVMIEEYNRLLELADKKSTEIKKSEETLGDMYSRVLSGAKSIYGTDSDEVTALGSTKKSERKHFRKKTGSTHQVELP